MSESQPNGSAFGPTEAVLDVKPRSRGRTKRRKPSRHSHTRSLSYGAQPRGAALFPRQPLAPQRRLSVPKLKLKAKFTRSQNLTLVCLAIVSFTSMLSMSLIAPFFPLEASLKGMRETVYGFVFSVYALVIVICSPIAGKIMPVAGPKFMLMAGIFVTGSSNVMFGVLDKITDLPQFTAYCFVIRIAEALGATAFSTASYTIIMQSFPDNIGTAFGIIETSVGLGLSLGPAIGGGLYGVGGYGLPFYTLGALMLLNIPICWSQTLFNHLFVAVKRVKRPSDSYLKLVSIPQVLVVGVVVVITSQTISFLDPTVEPHFRDLNIGPEYVSIVFLLLSFTYTISSPIVGWLSGLIHNRFPVMAFGLFLSFVALLLLGPSILVPLQSSLWTSVGAMALIGIAYAIAFIPTFETILDLAIDKGFSDDISTYSLVSGLWSAMYSLGEVTGPSLGGWLSENFDFSIASTIMASFSLIAAVIAGVTCLSVSADESESSSQSETECDNSSTYKSVHTSQYGSQSDLDSESKPLLDNSISNNKSNSYVIDFKDKEALFSATTI